MRSTPKDGPKLNKQAIWRNPTSNGFYVWGGGVSYAAQPPSKEIWRFDVDGHGGGVWSQASFANSVDFNRLTRSTDASFTQSKDVGYSFGGIANSRTDSSVSGDQRFALPGLVSYNMTSGEVRNTSSDGFGQYGTSIWGSAQFVPFGQSGLLLFLGGGEGPVSLSGVENWTARKDLDFNKITLYDPSTDKWYTQQIEGSRPTGRGRFCAVGVSSTDNTYEIFLYGGISSQTNVTFDDVFVLSLPGFIFFKVSGFSARRADHTCVVVGSGGRQMLSIGGTNGALGWPDSLSDPDPWDLGLGIFDMTELRWTDSYEPQAATYESPDMVKRWYDQGGLKSVHWTSYEVRALFTNSSSNTTSSARPQSSELPIGAIIGGAIGGVAGIGLAILVVFFLKRKKRNQVTPGRENDGTPPASQKPDNKGLGPKGSAGATTLHEGHTDHFNPVELPTEPSAAELSSSHNRQELG
ncbi:kelch repeat protein [Colletotrichum simmondsii]|uniref:Kelch repeat protein n=1 Tax=Colletotrichum simmondsii TaxID=703756 RepID=A0A135T4V2_9PEZI|nr:kelch repeat protein [Colletotrichum simmondsii]